jgi:hypothetical protein
MREQREPWLKLPEKEPGGDGDQRVDPRFRTHIVTTRGGGATEPHGATTKPLLRSPSQPLQAPVPPSSVLPFRPAAPPQRPVATMRAAEPVLSKPAPVPQSPPGPLVHRSAAPAPASAVPHPVPPKRAGVRAPGAPPLGINDLPVVSSADWVAKVGEAAKMVDVIVVFYTAAYLDSDMFQLAFQTVINEVLPHISRPYTVYRFCLDAEPSFVGEMAESLGLPHDNPVTVAGFAWSGPGRRLLLIGDRALESRAAFSRFLRRSLMAQQQMPTAGVNGARRHDTADFEGPRERAPRPRARFLGGRALTILAWCLFGTAALGAVVVGVAPQVARSVLQPRASAGQASAPTDAPIGSNAQAVNPPAANLDTPSGGSPGGEAQVPANPASSRARPAHAHARRKHIPSWLTLNPTYWGLPEERAR